MAYNILQFALYDGTQWIHFGLHIIVFLQDVFQCERLLYVLDSFLLGSLFIHFGLFLKGYLCNQEEINFLAFLPATDI